MKRRNREVRFANVPYGLTQHQDRLQPPANFLLSPYFHLMKLLNIAPDATRTSEILHAVARARGCHSPEQIAEFLAPLPPLRNPFRTLISDYLVSRDRIARAILKKEVVVVYGDYDADGICALVQVVRFLRLAGVSVRWFVPHRLNDKCGLTTAGIQRCIAAHHPSLMITVDCGSSSRDQILSLKKTGIDTVVLDHHSLVFSDIGAVAHLNPRTNTAAQSMDNLCAAGLAFLWTDALAADFQLGDRWQAIRDTNIILAGIGTLSDFMVLLDLNRALVKNAVHNASVADIRNRLPGLTALAEVTGSTEVDIRTFTSEWAPMLNACGRMDDATAAIELLLSPTLEQARAHAATCKAANQERRKEQERAIKLGIQSGEALLQDQPDTRILVIAEHSWHRGILGNVASRLKEHFQRPVIALAWDEQPMGLDTIGSWRGSGRCTDAIDLCKLVQDAVFAGIALEGGGHQHSVGVHVAAEQLGPFREFVQKNCDIPVSAFAPSYEIIGNATDLPPASWYRLLSFLAPFGNGNPQPMLCARRAHLAAPPRSRQSRDPSAQVFAMSGLFRSEQPQDNKQLLQFDWFDPIRAKDVWFPGRAYDLVLNLGQRRATGHASEPYYLWRVADCEPAA